MRKTRAEILIELQNRLGPNETTEHLIDWVLDLWETRDFLFRLLGRESTATIIEAAESSMTDARLHECIVYDLVLEDVNPSSLN